MTVSKEVFSQILKNQDCLLDTLKISQSEMKTALRAKNWTKLQEKIREMNKLSDDFQKLDLEREEIQKSLKKKDLEEFYTVLSNLRGKLLAFKATNMAISEYVKASREFIQNVIEKAIPKSGNKCYTKNGSFVQSQTQSVVVNQLF